MGLIEIRDLYKIYNEGLEREVRIIVAEWGRGGPSGPVALDIPPAPG